MLSFATFSFRLQIKRSRKGARGLFGGRSAANREEDMTRTIKGHRRAKGRREEGSWQQYGEATGV